MKNSIENEMKILSYSTKVEYFWNQKSNLRGNDWNT